MTEQQKKKVTETVKAAAVATKEAIPFWSTVAAVATSVITILSTPEFQSAICVANAEWCVPYQVGVAAIVTALGVVGVEGFRREKKKNKEKKQ